MMHGLHGYTAARGPASMLNCTLFAQAASSLYVGPFFKTRGRARPPLLSLINKTPKVFTFPHAPFSSGNRDGRRSTSFGSAF